MAIAILMCYRDVDEGAGGELILRASVVFRGNGVPGDVLSTEGPDGNGVPVTINNFSQYANNVEDALLDEASRLGVTNLARTGCYFPAYTRGA
jgi:hypothetical protein